MSVGEADAFFLPGAVVFGHSNVAGVHMENAGGKPAVYANPGSWAADRSYIFCEAREFKARNYGAHEADFKQKKT